MAQTRAVAPFAAVELAGTNVLVIHVGAPTTPTLDGLAVSGDGTGTGAVVPG